MIALRSLHAREIDAGKQHDQVRGADLDLRTPVVRGRKAKAADLEPLVPDRISVFFPDQELDPVGGLVSKTKMFPERGSPPRASRTMDAKLSNDFLRSVGCAQSQMRTVAGKLNMPSLRSPRRRADERG